MKMVTFLLSCKGIDVLSYSPGNLEGCKWKHIGYQAATNRNIKNNKLLLQRLSCKHVEKVTFKLNITSLTNTFTWTFLNPEGKVVSCLMYIYIGWDPREISFCLFPCLAVLESHQD